MAPQCSITERPYSKAPVAVLRSCSSASFMGKTLIPLAFRPPLVLDMGAPESILAPAVLGLT